MENSKASRSHWSNRWAFILVTAGSAIGTVANLRDTTTVTTTGAGTVTEWLVEDGDPVSPGQPLLRIYPAQD